MKMWSRIVVVMVTGAVIATTGKASAQDWPQWRGPNRDAKAADFKAPATWPQELTQRWKVDVGDGVSTPALADGKLFVFSRQDGNEITRCLDAATGKELWQDKYETGGVQGPAASFAGPRSSPTVAQGMVVTLGVHGVLSCLDAATGAVVWRKDDFQGGTPRFAASSSPIVVDGLCIAQLGSERDGGIVAYDLEKGTEKWKWTGSGPAYGSPVLLTIDGTQVIVAPTADKMAALAVADGNALWDIPYTQGRYNAATPIVEGQTLIFAGPNRGISAETLALEGGKLTTSVLWSNPDNSVQFSTPVVKDGQLYGLSTVNNVFCINLADGQTVWTSTLAGEAAKVEPPAPKQGGDRPGGGRRGGGMRGGGMRGGGGAGYGSVVDAGPVLLALTPAGELVVFQSNEKQYQLVGKYKVAEGQTYAYPIAAGSAIYIKDGNAVTMWSVE